MTIDRDGEEITDHSVWEVGQAVRLVADAGPWTIDRISPRADPVREADPARPGGRGGSATTC